LKNSSTAKPLILIVDDNPKNLQILGKYLQNEGYRVEFAIDGDAALKWVDRTDFDLILLDVMMPGKDGFEVCKIIKSDPVKQKIPVIFLTAKVDTESIVNGFDLGAVDYVIKPFNQKELIARVKTHIEIKRNRDEIARNLREIHEKNKLINYSIKYAERIQSALINTCHNGTEHFPSCYEISLPKDVVSGDFPWFFHTGERYFAGVFDCTGHGIPGAFMSILGMTYLNETVLREKIFEPCLIMNRLRERIIKALGQKGISGEVKDGMDGSIICYKPKERLLTCSGAMNPVCLVRRKQLIEFKGDKMPLSFHDKMNDFSSHEIETMPGDMVYLFTDGWTDQFGGPESKKLGSVHFKNLLAEVSDMETSEQRRVLTNSFLKWKGEEEQTDDITVVGLRL